MANPFPGIDPYVEDQGLWPDFHTGFLYCCRGALLKGLPRHYDARIEERLTVVSYAGDDASYRADVMVTRLPERPSPGRPSESLATIPGVEPVTIPLSAFAEESATLDRWIEVRRRPDRTLVAVIELLSPSNKVEPGRLEYLRKRNELVRQPVHLVELDFLARGRPLPMARPLPPGDAFAIVSDADRRPECDVYAWSIRRPLPTIPIPLDAPDPALGLDLAAIYATAYEEGDYGRTVDRDRPLSLPLAADTLAWSRALARGEDPPREGGK